MRAIPPVLVGVNDFSTYRLGNERQRALTRFREFQFRPWVLPLFSLVLLPLNVDRVGLTHSEEY